MRTLSFALAIAAAATVAAAPAGAQERSRADDQAAAQSRGPYPVGRGRPTLDGRITDDRKDDRKDGRWDGRRDDDDDRWDDRGRDSDDDRRRGGVVCLDRNHDGYCDTQRRRNDDVCFDRNRDGRCDGASPVGGGYSSSLPQMVRVGLLRDGRRTDEATRWLGTDARGAQSRYVDYDRDGNPERITWLDRSGRVTQVWVDRNDDGRADVVEIYQGGRLVRTVRR